MADHVKWDNPLAGLRKESALGIAQNTNTTILAKRPDTRWLAVRVRLLVKQIRSSAHVAAVVAQVHALKT